MRRARLQTLCAVAVLALAWRAEGAQPWETISPPGPAPKPAEQGVVEVNGAKLYYAIYGAGEPVILLHGGAGNSDHWARQIVALAGRYRVIVIDSRGHGRSTRDDKPFGYHLMASDVLAVMDKLKLERASLVGWSDGGVIGLDVAINNPGRINKLFAFGANYDLSGMQGGGPHATFAAYLEKCASDYQRLSPTPKDYKSFLVALNKMWRTEPNFKKEQLAKIKAATLVADGEHDEVIRQEHTREMASLIPGARLLLIPDASHFALWQQPEAFNKALLDFLAEK
jgi:pimeloyl-ACP methyl ester carboxylesterase